MKHYFHVWWILMINSFRTQVSTSLASTGYLIGKFLRFFFFLFYLTAIFKKLPSLNGYDMPSVVLFFVTFNLIDVGAQFLFRGLYGVKTLIEEGDFDKIVTQPVPILFRICAMGMDMLDLLTLIPIGFVGVWALHQLSTPVTLTHVFTYIFLMLNGILISYAFHVFVGALSVRTQEFESAIWVYRDVMTLGRFPVSVYSEVIRNVLITIVPIGVMISFPAQALLGRLSSHEILYAPVLGVLFYGLSKLYWNHALRNYASSSS